MTSVRYREEKAAKGYHHALIVQIEQLNTDELKHQPLLLKEYEKLQDWNWRYGETPAFEHNIENRFDWGIMVGCEKKTTKQAGERERERREGGEQQEREEFDQGEATRQIISLFCRIFILMQKMGKLPKSKSSVTHYIHNWQRQ